MTHKVKLYVTLALIAALAVWAYLSFEYVTEREHVGLRGEAARNPMLALTRLIQRMGVEVRQPQEQSDLEMLDTNTTLFLPRGRAAYSTARAERLALWVERGGHLIVEPEAVRQRDPVLDVLGVQRREAERKAERKAASVRTAPVQIELPGMKPLRVAMPRVIELFPQPSARVRLALKDAQGTTLLHLERGRGRVTIVPSFGFATNEAIGRNDHAAFAWGLVSLTPASTAVVIARRFERPSLLDWLAREARLPLAAGALLLTFWLWRSGVRFGPLAPDPQPSRRRLLDHLRASGRYLWRAGASDRLLAAARESCGQKIARTRPVLAALPYRQRVPRIAELTRIPVNEVEQAWIGTPATPAQFTAAVRTLQRIEEQLTRRAGA